MTTIEHSSPVTAPGEILELFKGGYLSAAEATDALERVFFYPASAPAQTPAAKAMHEAFMAMCAQRDSPDDEVFQDAIDALGMASSAAPAQRQPGRQGRPDPAGYWRDMYTDLLKRVYAGEFAQCAPTDPLTDLVERFSKALLAKLRLAEANGRSGWDRDDWEKQCQEGLLRHVDKGDPRDVAAYCAFMWHHGWITALTSTDGQEPQNKARSNST